MTHCFLRHADRRIDGIFVSEYVRTSQTVRPLAERLRLEPRIDARQSRAFLQNVGIRGEAIVNGYHSPDSISIATDGARAFVGDLPPATQMPPDDVRFRADMEKLRSRGVQSILPCHAAACGPPAHSTG